jgi:uncharacterized protein (TIGR03435 family)
MERFATLQQRALEQPVADQTGLTGRYDFDMEFTPDETLYSGAFIANLACSRPSMTTSA